PPGVNEIGVCWKEAGRCRRRRRKNQYAKQRLAAGVSGSDSPHTEPQEEPTMSTPSHPASSSFAGWPGGKRAAVSLSFDDAAVSQLDYVVPILNRYGVRGTFYV